ncbi:MAG: GNAT family N-acetyltransferase [Fimbriimonas sp.]
MIVRPLLTETDYAGLDGLPPGWAGETTPRGVDADGYLTRHAVVEVGATVAGVGIVERQPWREAGHFEVRVYVVPNLRNTGLGSELLREAEGFAESRGASRLTAGVDGTDPVSRAFAQARGYVVTQRFTTNILDMAAYDEALGAAAMARAEAAGYRLFTLAEAGVTAENHRRLYDLNRRLAPELPGNGDEFPSFEEFEREILLADWFAPEGQTVAAHGDRWIALVGIGFDPETRIASHTFSAVDPAHRGRGVGTALKAKALEYVRRIGATEVHTGNDATNVAILRVNERLGYRASPGVWRVEKRLRPTP